MTIMSNTAREMKEVYLLSKEQAQSDWAQLVLGGNFKITHHCSEAVPGEESKHHIQVRPDFSGMDSLPEYVGDINFQNREAFSEYFSTTDVVGDRVRIVLKSYVDTRVNEEASIRHRLNHYERREIHIPHGEFDTEFFHGRVEPRAESKLVMWNTPVMRVSFIATPDVLDDVRNFFAQFDGGGSGEFSCTPFFGLDYMGPVNQLL